MKEELLVTYSLRLRPDQIATIKQLEINFSNWARKRFDEDFMSPEEIDEKIGDLQKQIENLKRRKIMASKKIEDEKIIHENELDFLLETKRILDKDPQYTDGRIALYTNLFGKPYKISRAKFFEILERAAQIEKDINASKVIEPINTFSNRRGGEGND